LVPVFNGPVYKGTFPDIRYLLPVPNFLNSTSKSFTTVTHSFPSPFPRVCFKKCA